MKAPEGFDIERIKREKVTVLAKSLEKFTSIQIGNLQLKDSYQLLNGWLNRLVKNRKEEKENKSLQETFPITYEYFKKPWGNLGISIFELLTRKVFSLMTTLDSWKIYLRKKIPPKEDCYGTFENENITKEACNVFKFFYSNQIGHIWRSS